ncbi:MAG: MurT ligase domain-containing protein [Bacillota bacterium]|nr:MurT ligase domain-containing protein [Bacillota bacterium]
MNPLRFHIARTAGRLTRFLLRLIGRPASTLPGAVALRLAPGMLAPLAARHPILIVTGTNGKTTTTALIVHLLEAAGEELVTNAYGANLASGITSCLIAARPGTSAILEVDEAAFAALAGQLDPTLVVVTNIFPDQLDRFPSPATVRELIAKGIRATAPTTRLVLCADDPELYPLAGLGGRPTLHFGAAPTEFLPASDTTAYTCPVCGHSLRYRAVTIAQCGHYLCEACACHRPAADLEIARRDSGAADRTELEILWDGERGEARLALSGLYNAYNAAAALLAADAVRPDRPRQQLLADLESARPAPGRQETLDYRGRRLRLILVKNTAGLEESLGLVARQPDIGALAFLINNEPADGRDPAWVRAVRSGRFPLPAVPVGIGGSQTAVLADWLKPQLDGQEPIAAENDLAMVDRLVEVCPPERTIYLLPNYSALFALRRQLLANGAKTPEP